MNNKKAIGAVIATSLLLIVAVASVASFNTWFNTYSSDIHSKTDVKSDTTSSINLNLIKKQNNNLMLYYHNPSSSFIKISSITINSNTCTLAGSDVIAENSITQVEVSDCQLNKGEKAEIILITLMGVYTTTAIVK